MAIEKSNDPTAFVDFELTGWRENIAGYADAFGSVSRQTVDETLDAANVRAGMRVLDVCTGPGMLAEGAINRGAEAVGLDFSDAVVALAKTRVPAGEFRQGNAQDLPFPNESFDAVVCGYGVMHVPEPEIAMREMRRVVRPSGRIAISVWDSTTPNNAFGMLYAAVSAHGSLDVPLPHGPNFFQFGNEDSMAAALSEIGFSNVKSHVFGQVWHVKSAAEILQAIRAGTVRARALLAAQSDAVVDEILNFIEGSISGLGDPAHGFDIPLPAVIGSGSKP